MTDAELARSIAAEAGALLLALRGRMDRGGALGAEGDRTAQALIAARLAAARPDDFVLSEEAEDDPARCARSRLWVVDPLDGTAEYADGGDDWAVHVGLSVDGVPAVGAVALPARGLVLASDAPPPLAPLHLPPRMVVSRTRRPEECSGIAAAIGAELVAMGSAGAKAMAVVLGDAEIYLHSGGQYAWDNCAPVAVALAAGLHASRLDGSSLTYNCIDSYLPDLLICRLELAPDLLRLLAAAAARSA